MDTAAILVGGKGTRLQSLVSEVPKPLAAVAGEPFLFIILRAIRAAGLSRVILLTGYMHDKIVEACGDGAKFGLEILYSREEESLGTAGALKNAEMYLVGCDDFLLMNGDTYFDCPLDPIVNYPLKKDVLGVIGVSEADDIKRYGSIVLEENSNKIKSFREKENVEVDPSQHFLVSAGVYKISNEILQFIPNNQECSLETDIFPALSGKKYQLHAVKLSGEFCDIGVPDSYAGFNFKKMLSSDKFDPIARALFSLFLPEDVLSRHFKLIL